MAAVNPVAAQQTLAPSEPPAELVCATGATSWPALLKIARTRAPANRVADASVDVAEAQQAQARARAWMPRVDLAANANRQHQRVNDLSVRTPASAVTLQGALPLWRPSERALVDAQGALTEQAQWQARTQRVSVARELSLAYVAAAEAAEQHRLAQAQLDLLDAQLRINQRRLDAGLGTVLDELETRTRLEQVRATQEELAMRLTSQRLTVARLSGADLCVPAGLRTADTPPLPHTVPDLDAALQTLVQRNPQLLDAQAQWQAARADGRARDAEAWQPTVDATASVGRSRLTQSYGGLSERQNTTTRAVGVELNWALFSGGYQQGRTREGAALLVRAQAQIDEVHALVQARLRDAFQSLRQARAIVAAQQAVEQTATATHTALHKAFLAGTRTNLDLLNAQQQIYSARQNLVAARVTALTAYIDILALMDQLEPEHVTPLMAQFESSALLEPR